MVTGGQGLRYRNLREVADAMADALGGRREFQAWARREGPREAARRMDAARIECRDFRAVFRFAWKDFPGLADPYDYQDKGEESIVPRVVAAVTDDLRLVHDWMHHITPANGDGRGHAVHKRWRSLPHLTLARALELQAPWRRAEGERLLAHFLDGLDKDDPKAGLAAVGEGARFPVPGMPAGTYWTRLETGPAFRQESARMDHCVGWDSTGYLERYLGQPMPIGIWSLRRGAESLLTAEVVVEEVRSPDAVARGMRLLQVRGFKNTSPPAETMPAVRWLEGLRMAPACMGMSA